MNCDKCEKIARYSFKKKTGNLHFCHEHAKEFIEEGKRIRESKLNRKECVF